MPICSVADWEWLSVPDNTTAALALHVLIISSVLDITTFSDKLAIELHFLIN